jgi:hypothetical protein
VKRRAAGVAVPGAPVAGVDDLLRGGLAAMPGARLNERARRTQGRDGPGFEGASL